MLFIWSLKESTKKMTPRWSDGRARLHSHFVFTLLLPDHPRTRLRRPTFSSASLSVPNDGQNPASQTPHNIKLGARGLVLHQSSILFCSTHFLTSMIKVGAQGYTWGCSSESFPSTVSSSLLIHVDSICIL